MKIKSDMNEFLFDRSILQFIGGGLKKNLFRGKSLIWMIRHLNFQYQAFKVRKSFSLEGYHVPPMLIVSLTRLCNLHCKGCYSRALRPEAKGEMDSNKLISVLEEAKQLGISIALLAGGEPMMRFKDLITISESFPRILFPVFTNGLLIQKTHIKEFCNHSNLIPILSLEGKDSTTDHRRGHGVANRIDLVQANMNKSHIFYGISVTVDRHNVDAILQESFITTQIQKGVRIFFMIEFVPVEPGSEDKVLTQEQRDKLAATLKQFEKKYPTLFVSLPGEEEKFGGCLAAGRGFLHVNPEGKVEACPFAPFSDTSLQEVSLKEALKSKLMESIRDQHHLLTETSGGCALWNQQEKFFG
jgi:MoaA/NifB/PqqE/SkfB family radical SAM enzyme